MRSVESVCLELDSRGIVQSLRFGGVEFAAPAAGRETLFVCRLRDFVGNPLQLKARDFSAVQHRKDAGNFSLVFSDCAALPGTEVEIEARCDGAEIRWRIAVSPGREDFKVEWIDFPRIRLRRFSDGNYLLPFAEGTLVRDLEERERSASFRCEEADYPLTGVSGFYPGPAAMQFEAFYTGDAGLCFLCRDPEHGPKSIDFRPDGEAALPLLQHFTGGSGAVSYEVAVIGFRGDWQEAAALYREWMEHEDPMLPVTLETRMPRLLLEAPVLLIYPVKGCGLDHGGLIPNEYYPYSAALPVVARYRERWNCRILTLLMHWEGTAPWAPPYIWPPSGGEEPLAEFLEAMHETGDAVGLYGSGIGWTQKSMIDPAYDRTSQFAEEHLEKEICIGPRGEAFSRVCNGPRGQRIGYDLCPNRRFTQDTVAHEIASAARLGVDYLQYFDQNQGCSAPFCYSRRHGHPDLPGAWHTASMRELLAEAENVAGETLLGCENAAAQPYLGVCRLNDLRSHLAWGAGGVPVPLYPYLFHEYTAGFSGNGVCLNEWVDLERTPFFLQWELAWNFAFGNLLSVVLKDGGKIHWHWNLSWSDPEPAQEPLVELIANLMRLRRGRAADYLRCGRMEKAPRLSCGTRRIYLKNRPPVETPAVIASAWSCGERGAILLVNFGEQPEPCRIDPAEARPGFRLPPEKATVITVPPLDALLLEWPAK